MQSHESRQLPAWLIFDVGQKGHAMTLLETIDQLERLDDGLTICAAKTPEWTAVSNALLSASDVPAAELPLPYFLEVSVAKKVLSAWSFVRKGRVPTLSEKCEALIYYAENDAYLLPSVSDSK